MVTSGKFHLAHVPNSYINVLWLIPNLSFISALRADNNRR